MVESASAGARAFVDNVKVEWRHLWRDRIDDKVRAEGMANRDFTLLRVERGTVIIATRKYKLLDLKEILRSHEVENAERFVSPHPSAGGWGKFTRTVIQQQRRAQNWKEPVSSQKGKRDLQQKQGGRGWLHCSTKK